MQFGMVRLRTYLTASEEHGVESNCTQIPGGSTPRNLFEPPHVVSEKECGVRVLQVSSEWFDYTETYLNASSKEEQGVERVTVRSNHPKLM